MANRKSHQLYKKICIIQKLSQYISPIQQILKNHIIKIVKESDKNENKVIQSENIENKSINNLIIGLSQNEIIYSEIPYGQLINSNDMGLDSYELDNTQEHREFEYLE